MTTYLRFFVDFLVGTFTTFGVGVFFMLIGMDTIFGNYVFDQGMLGGMFFGSCMLGILMQAPRILGRK